MPMFVESAFKAVHGGCIYYSVRKIVPRVDNAVTKSIWLLVCSGVLVCSGISMNRQVKQRRARLVPGWVTQVGADATG